MRRISVVSRLLLALTGVLSIGVSIVSPAVAQSPSGKLPAPCKLDSPAVYLVVEGERRHIKSWDTFVNLGYTAADIIPCGDAATYPEGAPISRLIKGTGDAVYWMENGLRRHIPDMATFYAWDFSTDDISLLPDSLVSLWPLGDPLPAKGNASFVKDEVLIDGYTIQVISEKIDTYTQYHATISAPNQPTVTVPYIYKIGKLPAVDVTGEGDPDVLFLRDDPFLLMGNGTVVYNLGAAPDKVLDVTQIYHADVETGEGEFRDLDGDGAFEFITTDMVNAGLCAIVDVPVVLHYNSAPKRYGSANRQFPSFYEPLITAASAKPETQCTAITMLLYLDRTADAKALFDGHFPGIDSAAWTYVVDSVKQGRYYAPGS